VTQAAFSHKSLQVSKSQKREVQRRKSQIRKFFGSFCYHKAANFLGVKVRKSQIHIFLCLIRKSKSTQISLACSYPLIPNPHIFHSEGETPFFQKFATFSAISWQNQLNFASSLVR
jgi:hypothetical protein